jgi:hypothetical protein
MANQRSLNSLLCRILIDSTVNRLVRRASKEWKLEMAGNGARSITEVEVVATAEQWRLRRNTKDGLRAGAIARWTGISERG